VAYNGNLVPPKMEKVVKRERVHQRVGLQCDDLREGTEVRSDDSQHSDQAKASRANVLSDC
jgi:hypothetical protein